jgi:ribonuclease J
VAGSAASVTVFDGADTIGGTKILLAQGDTRLFLDFGTNYQKSGRYFEEFLQPRVSRGLVDPLELGLLPKLKGIYRPDLLPPGDYPEGDAEWADAHPSAVLLTHGHLDHAGGIAYLAAEIPVVATPTSFALLRAWQEAGKAGPSSEVAYLGRYRPTESERPVGDSQPGRLLISDRSAARLGRRFLSLGEMPGPLAALLGDSPFGDRTTFEAPAPARAPDRFGALTVRPHEVDHSVYGAQAYLIEADGATVAYTGDIRFHGERGASTEGFLRELEARRPEVLIVEGTRLLPEGATRSPAIVTEDEVERTCLADVARFAGRLVVADFGPRNVERLRRFRRIAQETGRELVLTPKDAFLLLLLNAADPSIEIDLKPGGMRILEEPSAGRENRWLAKVRERFADAHLTPRELIARPGRFLLCFSFFDCNDLVDLRAATAGGLWLYSSSEAHGEEQEFDFVRLAAWIEWAHMTCVGFRLEPDGAGRKRPFFEHPEDRGHHASGHATQAELLEFVRRADPKWIVPVHTAETPSRYARLLKDAGARGTVVEPVPGRPISW